MEIRSICFLLLGAVCSACSSMRQFNVETYNPADITYPRGVETVLMVNNAVAQPADVGYTYMLHGKSQDTCRAEADSALIEFCRSLGTTIANASYFKDVRLLDEPYRLDSIYLRERKLLPSEVKQLCEQNGTDAIISLEKILFVMEKNIETDLRIGMEHGTVKVNMTGVLRTYLPEKERPMASVVLQDSVMWEEYAPDVRMLNNLLPLPDQALRVAASYIASTMSEHFIPHWSESGRWYYHNTGARWKEASAFASAGKWDLAEEKWQLIEKSTSNKSAKAKACSNIALACEMQSRFDDALAWAKKSASFFAESEGDEGENTVLLKAYVKVLEERILADKKLNIQIGE